MQQSTSASWTSGSREIALGRWNEKRRLGERESMRWRKERLWNEEGYHVHAWAMQCNAPHLREATGEIKSLLLCQSISLTPPGWGHGYGNDV